MFFKFFIKFQKYIIFNPDTFKHDLIDTLLNMIAILKINNNKYPFQMFFFKFFMRICYIDR